MSNPGMEAILHGVKKSYEHNIELDFNNQNAKLGRMNSTDEYS